MLTSKAFLYFMQKTSLQDVKNPATLFGEDRVVLTVGNSQKINAMTIGWGQFGTLWGRQVITIYAAQERYTNELLETNEYFTVVGLPKDKKEALTLHVVYIGEVINVWKKADKK